MWEKKTIIQVGALAAAVSTILAFFAGAFSFVGWDLPPWAAQARVERLAEEISSKQQNIDQTLIELRKADLESRRANWVQIKKDAEDELKKNPDSRSAQREKTTAEGEIAKIDALLAKMQ